MAPLVFETVKVYGQTDDVTTVLVNDVTWPSFVYDNVTKVKNLHLRVCMCGCVWVSVCLSVCLSVSLSLSLCVRPLASQSIVWLSVSIYVCMYVIVHLIKLSFHLP